MTAAASLINIVGCVSRDGYNLSRGLQNYQVFTQSGRSRFRLTDKRDAPYLLTLHYEMNAEEMYRFRQFWAVAIKHGSLPFWSQLTVGKGLQYGICQPTQQYQMTIDPAGIHHVTVPVEVAPSSIVDPPVILCDVIWGGPIYALSEDDIWGGPIDNLATDVIEPCPGVLP